jgi:polysaccharide biosynthesis transport protein
MTREPSPYFIRRTAPPDEEAIVLEDYASVEEDEKPDIREYALILKRHRWLILAFALAALIAAALHTFTRTPIFTAHSTVLIERKPPPVLNIRDARSETAEQLEFYKTQYEILKSRALAAQAVREDGLGQSLFQAPATGAEEMGLIAGLWSDLRERVRDQLPEAPKPQYSSAASPAPNPVDAYLLMLEIRPVQGTSLVRIGFSTPDSGLSARLANAHAAAYMRYGLDLRSEANEGAVEFLQQKLLQLKDRVEKGEAALNSYRRDKGIISLDDRENIVVDRLADLNKRLTQAEAERISVEAEIRVIQGRGADELAAILNKPAIQGIKAELAKLEAEHVNIVREFKPGYPRRDLLELQIENLRERLSKEIVSYVRATEAAYATSRAREAELRARMEEQKKATLELKDSAVQYGILAREADTNRQLYDSVLGRLKEVGVAADLRTSNVYMVDKAEAPTVPSYPNKRRSLLLGLLLGLAGGVGFAFFLERLDDRFRSPEEVERFLRLPSLAVVPDFRRLTSKKAAYVPKRASESLSVEADRPQVSSKEIVLAHHPLSVVTEAYRALRSSILLSRAGEPPRTILVASAVGGEGKTVTTINSAIVFAQMNVQVLVIDGDLRMPRCHGLLGVDNDVGLTEVLAGHIDPESAIKKTLTDGVFLIPAGATPPNPAELLGSKKMRETLEALCQRFDYIFVDSSPILAVSDAVLLSTMVDGVVLVVDGQKTPKQLIRKVRSRLANSRTKVLGVVLNHVDTRNGAYAYHYRDYYSYYHRDSDGAWQM